MTISEATIPTATETPHVIEGFYRAFSGGDPEAAAEHLTSDFIMHVPGRGLNAGDYWGREGFKRFVRYIHAYNGGRFDQRLTALAVGDDDVFTREVVALNRRVDPDVDWNLEFIMHYRMKSGLISEAWTIPVDLHAYDRYWNQSSTPRPAVRPAVSAQSAAIEAATSPHNLALVQTWYDHFWNGELFGMRALMTDDFTWHTPGTSDLAGNYEGWDGYLSFRDKLLGLAGDKYKLDLDGRAASETDAFVKEHIRMNREHDPRVRTVEVILHLEIADGRIANVDDIPVDLHAYEAFYSV